MHAKQDQRKQWKTVSWDWHQSGNIATITWRMPALRLHFCPTTTYAVTTNIAEYDKARWIAMSPWHVFLSNGQDPAPISSTHACFKSELHGVEILLRIIRKHSKRKWITGALKQKIGFQICTIQFTSIQKNMSRKWSIPADHDFNSSFNPTF
jgi:hypothetical protein